MRRLFALALALALLVPSLLAAEVVIRPFDPDRPERPLKGEPILTQSFTKLDRPSSGLILPSFFVETDDALGRTTLFAVRNTTPSLLPTVFAYFDVSGNLVRQDIDSLDPRATRSVNLRDVPGLPTDNGVNQGFALIVADSEISTTAMTGDFFQVDIGGAFATGERLVSLEDICLEQEIRFLDFGSGTDLQLLINIPQGADPDNDPPSAIVTPVGEDGALLGSLELYTDLVTVALTAADFTDLSFGTLIFDFTNSEGGWVFADYSADGLFSVGVNSTCLVEVPPSPINLAN